MSYCPDVFNSSRRISSTVRIGSLLMGGTQPVRVQSMTNTSTMDTEGSIAQAVRMVEAGAELVRLTAQGEREAANLATIKAGLRQRGCDVPLVADIHFNPKAADEAALHVEKVRINPGNYVDPVKTFRHFEYTEAEYAQELNKIRERFLPFLKRCSEHHTAIRIGVNHGSLSDRIMSRYGDTPEGMVESCLEFLRLCVEVCFADVVISIKASNTLVMVQTVRLLVERMNAEGMHFPLHLGVTEAGDGEDGRIKSAIGIGSLLLDGIGDTIRVSLSEEPEHEIPVAKQLIEAVERRSVHKTVVAESCQTFNPFSYHRRETNAVECIGGMQVPVVMMRGDNKGMYVEGCRPDFVQIVDSNSGREVIADVRVANITPSVFPIFTAKEFNALSESHHSLFFIKMRWSDLDAETLQRLNNSDNGVVLMYANNLGERRAFFHTLLNASCKVPVVVCVDSPSATLDQLQLGLSLDVGPLLLDGFGDGIMYTSNEPSMIASDDVCRVLFGILQATRLRISKTEYISCPGCGRTLFDLQRTIARIKQRTSHLKGLKIGIMGCIVNGPGEMADADYGYVGAGRGRVSLYKGQSCVEKNIPEASAVDKLIELIKQHGDWKEP